ncbi:MAG: low molecular weight protein-tyrosine-phosphatase [Nitratireductor sp.]
MSQMKQSVLFVCLGNICRSPLAEGLFRHHVARAGLGDRLFADSAGTGDWHSGEPPHPNSVLIAARNGIDISGQRARQLQTGDLGRFELICGMDASNVANIRALSRSTRAGNTHGKRAEIVRFMDAGSMEECDVPDPWSKGMEAYQKVFDMINSTMPRLIDRLLKAQKRVD